MTLIPNTNTIPNTISNTNTNITNTPITNTKISCVTTYQHTRHLAVTPLSTTYIPLTLTPPSKIYPFKLDTFQLLAINAIERNESVLVSAHTSSGKTLVAEHAIHTCISNNQRVIYTSPIKALSNQKYRELLEKFNDVGLMTGDVTLNPSSSCIVMTTEILRNMLYKGSEILREVKYIIFDEIHYMKDKERGVVWEESIVLLPCSVRMVFLSATVPNALQFAEWITYIHQQTTHVIYTDKRPTPLIHYIAPLGEKGMTKVCYNVDCDSDSKGVGYEGDIASKGDIDSKVCDYKGDIDTGSKQQGVNYKDSNYKGDIDRDSSYKGDIDRDSKQQGVNTSTNKQQGVNNLSNKQQGVNISTNKQQGVNNLSNKQQGVNTSTNKQQGVNNLSNKQHPSNPTHTHTTNPTTTTPTNNTFFDRKAFTSVVKSIKRSKRIESKNIFQITETLIQNNNLPAIFFSFSRKDCEKHALSIEQDFLNSEEKKMIKIIFSNALSTLRTEDRNLPLITNILPLLMKGIGIHHSGLLPILKEVIEILFQENLLKILFATETFSIGLNMPAKTVIFTSLYKFDGILKRILSSGEYIQMSGRAGRRGLDDKGIVIVMLGDTIEEEEGVKLFSGVCDRLDSAFYLSYNMVLNLMRVEGLDPLFLLGRSFYHFQNIYKREEVFKEIKKIRHIIDKYEYECGGGSGGGSGSGDSGISNRDSISRDKGRDRDSNRDSVSNKDSRDSNRDSISSNSSSNRYNSISVSNNQPNTTIINHLPLLCLERERLLIERSVSLQEVFKPYLKVGRLLNIFIPREGATLFINAIIITGGDSSRGKGRDSGKGRVNNNLITNPISNNTNPISNSNPISNNNPNHNTNTNTNTLSVHAFMRGGIKRMQINKTCINNIYDIRVKEDFIFKENNKIPFINIKSEYDYKIYEIESEISGIESGIESKGYESKRYESKGYESKGYESKGYESKGYESKGYESKGYESKGYESKGYESKGYESKGYDSISKGINRYESKGYDSISKGCYLCGREYIVSKCIEGICYDPIAEYDSMDSVLDSSIRDRDSICNRDSNNNSNTNTSSRVRDSNRYDNTNTNKTSNTTNTNKRSNTNNNNIYTPTSPNTNNTPTNTTPTPLKHFRLLYSKNLIIRKYNTLNSLNEIYHMEDCKKMISVLRRLEYCDINNKVLVKGRVACEISSSDELILTEMIFNGDFISLGVDEIVPLLSCMVFSEWEENNDLELSEQNNKTYRLLKGTVDKISKVMSECGLYVDIQCYYKRFSYELMDVVRMWVLGFTFSEICCKTNVFEGSIIRCFRRLEELMRQLSCAARGIGNSELEGIFSLGVSKIKRDIVFASSLYFVGMECGRDRDIVLDRD
ncbi:DSHCT domain-containing RNA helicase [Hamiltosporidium tvaerminnensis]|uniref:DSHCT domain-containing RNA helicase n=1 Tax=Hamiltosporidium tvaerminnensis TaxID=1176355 RepID=A0A4V2JUH3_9MICR|nr:DSHCT domain-containing RNA helicase [Hamiltosporidium tvaerminnensis]